MNLRGVTAGVLTGLLAATLLAGCGGGGGGGGASPPPPGPPPPPPPPPADPFGLTSRPPFPPLDLPGQSVALGDYDLQSAFSGFPGALFLSGIPAPGDDRLVVLQQTGEMRTLDPATGQTATVLDLSGRVLTDVEQGLLGLAFDPDFVSNGYFYVHYSTDAADPRSQISRFTWANAGQGGIDPASEREVLRLDQPFANHNGGALAFGPDGMLYVAFGDGGGSNAPEAQNLGNWYGTLLRIDPHPADPADGYDIPPDNPFASSGNAVTRAIYAYGLRNPFRFSFDRATGELWVADVGESDREEINVVEAGGNYGWPVFEGTLQRGTPQGGETYLEPLWEYDHSQGNAIIGGFVYRGNDLPGLVGRYVYADLGSGRVWALRREAGGQVDNQEIITPAQGERTTSFGEDVAGELYVVTPFRGLFTFTETGGGGGGGSIPDLLSETGVFADLASLATPAGLIEYEINHPFWSDGTSKRRWVGVPDGQRVDFSATGAWQFPVGSVVVKHFEIDLVEGDPGSARRLETRLLVNTQSGWQGFTYRWNPSETDAVLLSGRETETLTIEEPGGGTRTQLYEYPSRTDCLNCHTDAGGPVLGLRTRQMNRDFAYANATDNQLRAWNHVDLFDTDIGDAGQYQAFVAPDDTSATLQTRARTYLAVNCAQCHRPGTDVTLSLDLRFDTANADMRAIGQVPQAGDLGITDARIIAPGDRQRSVLWRRMEALDSSRMPPIGSHRVDAGALAVIGDWIDTL